MKLRVLYLIYFLGMASSYAADKPKLKVEPGLELTPTCAEAIELVGSQIFNGADLISVHPSIVLNDYTRFHQALTSLGILNNPIYDTWTNIQKVREYYGDGHPHFTYVLNQWSKLGQEPLITFVRAKSKGPPAVVVTEKRNYGTGAVRYGFGKPMKDEWLRRLFMENAEQKPLSALFLDIGPLAQEKAGEDDLADFVLNLFNHFARLVNQDLVSAWVDDNLSLVLKGHPEECDPLFTHYVLLKEKELPVVDEAFVTVFAHALAVRTEATAAQALDLYRRSRLLPRELFETMLAQKTLTAVRRGDFGPGPTEALAHFKLGPETLIIDESNFVSVGEKIYAYLQQTRARAAQRK